MYISSDSISFLASIALWYVPEADDEPAKYKTFFPSFKYFSKVSLKVIYVTWDVVGIYFLSLSNL